MGKQVVRRGTAGRKANSEQDERATPRLRKARKERKDFPRRPWVDRPAKASKTERTTCRWCGSHSQRELFAEALLTKGSGKKGQISPEAVKKKATGTNWTCADERLHRKSKMRWGWVRGRVGEAPRCLFSAVASTERKSVLTCFLFRVSFRSNAR